MTQSVDKIPDLDERMATLDLYTEQMAAGEELAEAMASAVRVDGLDDKLSSLHAEYDRRLGELRAWYDAEHARRAGERGWAAAERAYHVARAAYDEARPLLVDDEGEVVLCAVSGAPLYEDDIVIEVGSHVVLAAIYVPAGVLANLAGESLDPALGEAA